MSTPSSGHQDPVVRVFHAYRSGLLAGTGRGRVLPRRDFHGLCALAKIEWLPVGERQKLRRVETACGLGLAAARAGDLASSAGHYRAARDLLAPLGDTSETSRCLALSVYRAGVAYLDSRRGDFDAAREGLDRSMDADLRLEHLGLALLQLHRIQQGHNLVRLFLYEGLRTHAMELTGRLYDYMEGQASDLPYHHDWRPGTLGEISRDLLRGTLEQVIEDTALLIVRGREPDAEWSRLLAVTSLDGEPSRALSPAVRHALLARRARLAGDDTDYLRHSAAFLGGGLGGTRALWYLHLAEFRRWCRQSGGAVRTRVAEVLDADSRHWRDVPPTLRSLVEARIA